MLERASRPRLIATGASNLARMALALLDAARAAAGGPIEAHFALGRGRAYCVNSALLGRGLGDLVAAPLWPALAGAPPAPTTALLMDVGNDLLYGVPVPRILAAVDTVLARYAAMGARIVVQGLPVAAIGALPRWRFGLVKRVLVPRSPLTWQQAIEGSQQLHDGLCARAHRHGATFHAPRAEWYGLDPVHVRGRCQASAAAEWLGRGTAAVPAPACDGTVARLRFLLSAPAERTWFGQVRRQPQPCRRWPDDTTLSLW
jgi:hypothetical protein